MTTRELIHHYLDRNQKFGDTNDYWRFQYHEDGPLNWKHIWVWDVESKACQIVERLYKNLLSICTSALEKANPISTDRNLTDFTIINTTNYCQVFGNLVHTPEFEEFEYALAELQKVQLNMDVLEKVSFWINVYNLLALHSVVISASKNDNPYESYFSRKRFFQSFTYIIGNMTFTLDDIEHGILRAKTGHFHEGDDRLLHKLDTPEPRIFSVLNCCNKTSPRPLIIKHTHVARYLNYACRRHFSNVKFADNTIYIPKVCDWYKEDYGAREDLIKFLQTYLRHDQNQMLSALLRGNRLSIKFLEFEWELYLEFKDYDVDPDDPVLKDGI